MLVYLIHSKRLMWNAKYRGVDPFDWTLTAIGVSDMRMEKDSLGELPVPDDAYYGIQTVRCASNYDVTDHTFNELPKVIRAVAEVKKACAITTAQIGDLE